MIFLPLIDRFFLVGSSENMFRSLPWINLELLGRIGVVENFWVILESYSNSNSELQLLGFPPLSLIHQSGCVRLIVLLWSLLQGCRSFFSLQLSYKIHPLIPSGLRVMPDLLWLVRWFLSSGFSMISGDPTVGFLWTLYQFEAEILGYNSSVDDLAWFFLDWELWFF